MGGADNIFTRNLVHSAAFSRFDLDPQGLLEVRFVHVVPFSAYLVTVKVRTLSASNVECGIVRITGFPNICPLLFFTQFDEFLLATAIISTLSKAWLFFPPQYVCFIVTSSHLGSCFDTTASCAAVRANLLKCSYAAVHPKHFHRWNCQLLAVLLPLYLLYLLLLLNVSHPNLLLPQPLVLTTSDRDPTRTEHLDFCCCCRQDQMLRAAFTVFDRNGNGYVDQEGAHSTTLRIDRALVFV